MRNIRIWFVMKRVKLISAILSLIMLLSCGVLGVVFLDRTITKARVVTTVFPIYDIVKNLLGSDEDVIMLQSGSSDVHNYEPTSKDIMTMSKSDLFICIGGKSDEWTEGVLSTINNDNLKVVKLFDSVNKIEESEKGIIQSDHHHDEHNHEIHSYDEHIWTSIKNMVLMTESIRKALVEIFVDSVDVIEINYQIYKNKLLQLEKEYEDVCLNNNKTIIVADRFPFLYLMNDYNLKYNALFSTCSSESEATTDSIVKIIESINVNKVDYIIVLENSQNLKTAERIVLDSKCENKNIEILTLNSCQSMNIKDDNNIDYLGIMKSNLENLKKVLGYEFA